MNTFENKQWMNNPLIPYILIQTKERRSTGRPRGIDTAIKSCLSLNHFNRVQKWGRSKGRT